MRNYKLKIVIFIFVVFLLLSIANSSNAAELFFEPQTQEIKVGENFQVDLYLDAQDEEINAVEGRVVFPTDLLTLKQVLDGSSIISLWVQKPALDAQSQISYSGIIPGGFKGVLSPYYKGYKPGKVLSLILKAKNIGEGSITLKDVKILLNDGLGTSAKVSIVPFQFKISQEAPSVQGIFPISDPDSPEPFQPIITKDPNVFNGKWFLVFTTQDKGSGIDYYAIYESRQKKETTRVKATDWVEASSPFLLKDQALRSFIYVKAVDKAGNERIAELSPKNPFRWYENILLWGIIILTINLLWLIAKKVRKQRDLPISPI